MATLSHILASFDIFQVIIAALPGLFSPIFNAFRDIFMLLYGTAAHQFEAHPGILSGGIIFLFGYLIWSAWKRLRLSRIFTRNDL
ncbi:MAG TPA: hypothetical protein PKG48_12860 [Bacteroidales bacterium]|nr:hypothetical protein [Bacteroidales bacterium]HPS63652.1 hypothetical protein [Bacteroidales bacterium]